MIEIGIQNTKIGKLKVCVQDGKVISIGLLEEKEEVVLNHNDLIQKTFLQLQQYFEGKRKRFTVPFVIHGTNFQMAVYKELLKIPYGTTVSYQEIAKRIQNPKAVRAVGGANHRNQIPFIIPCHRVVNKDKTLGGYGLGLALKEFLLNLEQEKK